MAKATDLLMRIHDDPMRGLVVTNWVDTGLSELEWGGGLGKAESVRLPGVTLPVKTPVCGVFPRMPDGGLEVLMNLEVESTESLRGLQKGGGCRVMNGDMGWDSRVSARSGHLTKEIL